MGPREDVVLRKAERLQQGLQQARTYFANDPARLGDRLHQDAILLNLQRACEAAIDLAMHVVRDRMLGVPKDSREAFRLMNEAGLLDASLAKSLEEMVGFRNVLVHEYERVDLAIVRQVLTAKGDDLLRFVQVVLRLTGIVPA